MIHGLAEIAFDFDAPEDPNHTPLLVLELGAGYGSASD